MRRTCWFVFKRLFLVLVAFFGFISSVQCKENLISSVTISKPKELGGAYQLVLKAEKPVDYRVKVDSQDSVYFDLKNSVLVDNIDTIYDNVSGIDGVIVQQLEGNKVRIYVNGVNTATTQLAFKTVQNKPAKQNTIVLNRPLKEYAPTVEEEIWEEDINWSENSFSLANLLNVFGSKTGEKRDMTFAICFALLIVSIVVSRKVFAKIKIQDSEPIIGLNSVQKEEVQQAEPEQEAQDIKEKLEIIKQQAIAQREALRQAKIQAQPQINPALKYAGLPYQTKNVLRKGGNNQTRNLVKENYARSAYESSQKNPYTTRTQPLSPSVRPQQQVTYQKRVQPQSPYVSRVAQEAPKAQGQKTVDNIKFLESVSKIYEQSGRGDLAQGLRVSINNKKKTLSR